MVIPIVSLKYPFVTSPSDCHFFSSNCPSFTLDKALSIGYSCHRWCEWGCSAVMWTASCESYAVSHSAKLGWSFHSWNNLVASTSNAIKEISTNFTKDASIQGHNEGVRISYSGLGKDWASGGLIRLSIVAVYWSSYFYEPLLDKKRRRGVAHYSGLGKDWARS